MKSNIIDIDVVFHHQTDKAILVAVDEETEPVWLPKSQVEIEDDDLIRGFLVCVTLPEQLALEKGLI